MKLSELKKAIERAEQFSSRARNDDPDVVVVVERPGTIGGMPCVQIRFAGMGIDWDSGKFQLFTETPVSEVK